MKRVHFKKGYSLVEVLVAVAILMLSIVGPITIAAKSLQSAMYARDQITAFFLAQEGITIANTLRNDGGAEAYVNASVNGWSWTANANLNPCYTATGCNIDFRDSSLLSNVADCSSSPAACTLLFDTSAARASYQLVSGEVSPFTRVLTFDLVTADELQVVSTVRWDSPLLGGEQEVTVSTSLFNIYE